MLLTVEGQLKIADFCLADTFVEAALTETGTILGTPAYMAPELASGKHHLVGRGTDIYSLGAILYECLTGQRPFVGATMLEMIQHVIDTEPIPPSRVRPAIPHALEIICLKCLHKDPRQRYATAAELAADLRRFREEQALGEDRAVSTSSRSGCFSEMAAAIVAESLRDSERGRRADGATRLLRKTICWRRRLAT